MSGTNALSPQFITCTNWVLHTMDFTAGRMYVEKFFDHDSKRAVKFLNYFLTFFFLFL